VDGIAKIEDMVAGCHSHNVVEKLAVAVRDVQRDVEDMSVSLREVQSGVKDLKVAVQERGVAFKKRAPALREVQKGEICRELQSRTRPFLVSETVIGLSLSRSVSRRAP
jgi:outer membrane murein-binding lipoprotein Lpp